MQHVERSAVGTVGRTWRRESRGRVALDVAGAIGGILAAFGSVTASLAAPPERTLPVDPIELVAGREVPGKPELAIEHEGYEYRFANDANKSRFAQSPSTFEVADGGACGAMGALSGLGDARRYAVHGGRIWLFASDGCRASFLKDPSTRIEGEDPLPTCTPEQVAAGRAIMDRAVAAAGGVDRLRELSTYRAYAARQEPVKTRDGERMQRVTNEVAIAFPDRYLQRDAWDEHWYSTTRTSEATSMASASRSEKIATARRRAFDRWTARQPVVLLKAYVDGAAAPAGAASGRTLIVCADGQGTIDGVAVDFVKVALAGATSRLAVDARTGRLVQLAFHGRDGTTSVGDSVRTYTVHSTVDGITLPIGWTVTFNGKAIPASGVLFDVIEVNPALPAGLFALEAK